MACTSRGRDAPYGNAEVGDPRRQRRGSSGLRAGRARGDQALCYATAGLLDVGGPVQEASQAMSLDPQDIEAIASRVVELLLDGPPSMPRLADAATVARELGVERDWVYAHAGELGATRLGGGRGRLRFDLPQILREVAAPGDQRTCAARRSRPAARTSRRQPDKSRRDDVELIPYAEVRCTGQIGGRAARERPRPDTGR